MRGLYLHIPFCEKKCLYCDFYSLETTHLIESFLDVLIREISLRAALYTPEEKHFSTVFFGGGTPSLLVPAQMERIVQTLHQYFTFTNDAEWTMECNPGTVTQESLAAYRMLGINRLSFGVQSFFEDDLKFLTRIHSREDAFEAIAAARRAGFDNVNLDLIFALPGQTVERWQNNLTTAIELGTEHISAYSLIFEEGTPLNAMRLRGEVHETDESIDAEMYDVTMNFLAAHGYRQYEVSNFAKPGKQCRHNLLYWQGREYLSFGPSAHGYMQGVRYWNVRSLNHYTGQVLKDELPTVNSEKINQSTALFERAFLELRSQGIDIERFQRDFDIDLPTVLRPLLLKIEGEGLLTIERGYCRLTQRGYALCDALSADIIVLLEQYCGEEWTGIVPEFDQPDMSGQPVTTQIILPGHAS